MLVREKIMKKKKKLTSLHNVVINIESYQFESCQPYATKKERFIRT